MVESILMGWIYLEDVMDQQVENVYVIKNLLYLRFMSVLIIVSMCLKLLIYFIYRF